MTEEEERDEINSIDDVPDLPMGWILKKMERDSLIAACISNEDFKLGLLFKEGVQVSHLDVFIVIDDDLSGAISKTIADWDEDT